MAREINSLLKWKLLIETTFRGPKMSKCRFCTEHEARWHRSSRCSEGWWARVVNLGHLMKLSKGTVWENVPFHGPSQIFESRNVCLSVTYPLPSSSWLVSAISWRKYNSLIPCEASRAKRWPKTWTHKFLTLLYLASKLGSASISGWIFSYHDQGIQKIQ